MRGRSRHVADGEFRGRDDVRRDGSGHSTRGTLFALLLAELLPEKRDAILDKGRESGWLRVLGGVHYPTDVFAGRVLGQGLAREFLASPAFQHDFAEVKAELAAAKL